jgi:hypothetical protein
VSALFDSLLSPFLIYGFGGLPELGQALAAPKCEAATLADPYRNYPIDYSSPEHCKAQEQTGLLVYQSSQPQVVHHGASADLPFAPRGAQHSTFHHQQHQHATALQTTATHPVGPDVHHQAVLINPHQMVPSPLSSHYGSNPLQFHSPRPGKRPRPVSSDETTEDERRLELHLQMLPPEAHAEGTRSPELLLSARSDSSSQRRPSLHAFAPSPLQQHQQQQQQHHHHHHHRLPSQAIIHPSQQSTDMLSPTLPSGLPSVVGQAGMPEPAPRPRGPKLKFTPEEDALLVELKEHKNLTWKQISDFFPGRTSGTLQVRYCTKLKAKDTVWTDEMVKAPGSSCGLIQIKDLLSLLTTLDRYNDFATQSRITKTTVGGS